MADKLPAAAYKMTEQVSTGRGVYTFCMCPGGYVVNASSEEGLLAVNGMSYSGRDGENANSAVIVTVTPEDFGDEHPLAGVKFQRNLERKAFEAGCGKIPVQRFEDFCKNTETLELGNVRPAMKGQYQLTNIRPVFPAVIANSLEEGIQAMDKKISGYERLSSNGVVELDEERKAAMVSNLLVVLCGNRDAQPVVNSGSLY